MPKVSVIVPIFKVEKYIERCARSLFEQTLDDLEYIFIDDCSPDNSVEVLLTILEEYPSRKQQTRIVRFSTNSGLATVRRKGQQLATGDFIINCDSDDWVDRDLYQNLYDALIRHNADIAICDIKDVYKNNKVVVHLNIGLPEFAKEAIKNLYRHYFHLSTANKLIRRSILIENNIFHYEGINMWEDNGFMYRVFYYAKKLVQVKGSFYYYNRTNEVSISTGYGKNAVDQMIQCANNLTCFFREKTDYEDFANCIQFIQYLAKINLITTEFSGISEFESIFPDTEHPPKGFDKRAFSSKGRVRLFFVENHLAWLFIILFKMKNLFFNHKK